MSRLSLREYERRRQAETVLRLLEKHGYDVDRAKAEVKRLRKNSLKVAEKIERGEIDPLSVQHPLFAVASPVYASHQLRRQAELYDRILGELEALRSYAVDADVDRISRVSLEMALDHKYRGFKRRARRALEGIRRVEWAKRASLEKLATLRANRKGQTVLRFYTDENGRVRPLTVRRR